MTAYPGHAEATRNRQGHCHALMPPGVRCAFGCAMDDPGTWDHRAMGESR